MLEIRYQLLQSYREIYRLLSMKLRSIARDHGLSHEEVMILKVLQKEQFLNLKQLSEKMEITMARCSYLTNLLTDAGLINRTYSLTDRRKILLRLSIEGEEKIERIFGKGSEFETIILNAFSLNDEQINKLINAHYIIIKNLHCMESHGGMKE
ncbi:MarR family winged helix-turn-helix transcriptional regulator [Alicyclobacillus tolerans]|uniref:HTH-type transcriptional regulator SarZ n=1 Tax=Alicyclobacillus tolerans TaxID=90970 RepID=A0A1M6TFT1_9BACL|nr:MarR family transcriptional regulator [Alicyclobacillus montanus]SHK55840.1 DNA-binding transcriptional regulator, MarR family [Alicyclobacillus montanus]